MTVLEFWGYALVTFGPALAMFTLTVAHDPIKIILLITSSFFWLLSFLTVAICWAIINPICHLVVGAYLAVLSQEAFRYLFHKLSRKAEQFLAKIIGSDKHSSSSRSNEIQINNSGTVEFQRRIPISYVSGLGFGLMNAAFALMNVLTDSIGPGNVGIDKQDSAYFFMVSSLTALAFILLNVAWSILMSESIEKSDKKLAAVVIITHLMATTITLVNGIHLQLVSILVVYLLTLICGLGAFQVTGLDIRRLVTIQSTTSS